MQQFVIDKNISAGWIVSCIGSLTKYSIRFANQHGSATGEGHFEIISASGTLSVHGSHIHIGISDDRGNCFGGHLVEGSTIYTTAEIILAKSNDLVFKREVDVKTGYRELMIAEASS